MSASTQVAQTVVSKVVTSPLGTTTSSSSLDPNTLLDALVEHIKEGLTSNESSEVSLESTQVSGIRLSDGKLLGLASLTRYGNAVLETKPDRVVMTFTLELKDLHAVYIWRRKSLKGEIAASVGRAFLSVKLRQRIKSTATRPEILEFALGNSTEAKVGLHGLGPLNWMGKKAVFNLVQHNIRQVLEMKAKEVMKQQLHDFSLLDNITNNILPQQQGANV